MIELISFLRNLKHITTNLKFVLVRKKLIDLCPKIINEDETVSVIKGQGVSVSRFGDGEFRWMFGIKNDSFQDNDKELEKSLRRVLNSNLSNHIVCVPFNFIYDKKFTTENLITWKNTLLNYWKIWLPVLNKNKVYYDSNFSRPYIDRKNKKDSFGRFERIRKIWDKKSVLVVEGEKTRFGVGNDLFENTNKVGRILCPSENAFSKYKTILKATIELQGNYDVILIALGPTATVLAYDLARYNCKQAIDIGHLDVEYEWFLSQAKKRQPIKGKYVNELERNERFVKSSFEDARYDNEIKKIIT